MKKILFSALILLASAAYAQDASEIKPAAKGVVYGEALSASSVLIHVNELNLQANNEQFRGRMTGKVTEVCKSMGCWIKLEKADGTTLTVRSKDHGFFMPQDLVGHTVAVEGEASVKEVSEEVRRHMAEDAGKSKAEIKKIKGATKQAEFVAKGVEVLD